jgi:hypothetical protein
MYQMCDKKGTEEGFVPYWNFEKISHISVFGVICWVFRGYSGYNWAIRYGIVQSGRLRFSTVG